MEKHEVARRAVFLDRDGVLNRPVVRNGQPHPPFCVEDFELYDDVADGCRRLKTAEFLLIVISNQPDVGRGTQSREAVEAMHTKMRSALPSLDRIEICYHAGERYGEPCDCRKPRPGMILRAAADLKIDLVPVMSSAIAGAISIVRVPQVVERFLLNAAMRRACARRPISLLGTSVMP